MTILVLFLGVEKKIFKEIMHFQYMTCIATFQHSKPCPGGHEIYNFGTLFLGHHNYKLRLSVLCLRVEWRILKDIMHVHYIYMVTLLHKNPCPGGNEIYNSGRPFLGHHNHTLSLSVLCLGVEKKMFRSPESLR